MTNAVPSDAETYSRVVESFALGIYRFWGAEAASARLMCALTSLHGDPAVSTTPERSSEAISHLLKIPFSSYDALRYVTDVSHLVYATTLLDTFLSDTTLFLLLRHPRAIGKEQQVSLGRLLAAGSRSEVITEAAGKKAREASYLPFTARVQYLRETFGLTLLLSDALEAALAHFPSVRNTAVHDQGVFEFALDEQGHVMAKQKACAHHPTPVSYEAVASAADSYASIAYAVAKEVFEHVLHAPGHPALMSFGATALNGAVTTPKADSHSKGNKPPTA